MEVDKRVGLHAFDDVAPSLDGVLAGEIDLAVSLGRIAAIVSRPASQAHAGRPNWLSARAAVDGFSGHNGKICGLRRF